MDDPSNAGIKSFSDKWNQENSGKPYTLTDGTLCGTDDVDNADLWKCQSVGDRLCS